MNAQCIARRVSSSLAALAAIFLSVAALWADKNQPNINDPFEPTPPQVVDEMLKFAQVTPSDYVFDLGCGDGRIVIAAAKNFGARAFGVDLDPQRIEECKEGAEAAGVTGKATFLIASYFDADLRPATVLATYLLAETNLSLRPKYLRELRPGTRLVSHCFDMADWKADKTVYSAKARENKIHYWVIPASVGGTWRWSNHPMWAGDGQFRLDLQQQFQAVSGVLTDGNAKGVEIRNATISGKSIQFSVTLAVGGKPSEGRFTGTVEGDTIQGMQRWTGGPNAGNREWTARREPLEVAGTWRVTVKASPIPLDGALKISRKGDFLQALYARDNPTTQTALPSWISWGNSVYFEIPPEATGDEDRGPVFSGSLGAQDGQGTVTWKGWPASRAWSAKREK